MRNFYLYQSKIFHFDVDFIQIAISRKIHTLSQSLKNKFWPLNTVFFTKLSAVEKS